MTDNVGNFSVTATSTRESSPAQTASRRSPSLRARCRSGTADAGGPTCSGRDAPSTTLGRRSGSTATRRSASTFSTSLNLLPSGVVFAQPPLDDRRLLAGQVAPLDAKLL